MQSATQLNSAQRKLIQSYVSDLFEQKIKLLEKYYDVDAGLELSEDIIGRLTSKKRTRKISHAEFWDNVVK